MTRAYPLLHVLTTTRRIEASYPRRSFGPFMMSTDGGRSNGDADRADANEDAGSDDGNLHGENPVRPETAHIPERSCSAAEAESELVFFNAFFCPYAQMAWIALNEKGVADRAEFVEGLTIVGGDYQVHPRLRKLGHLGVPTIYHKSSGTVVGGSTECIIFIDDKFGRPNQLIPENVEMRERAVRCEQLLHSLFTFQFYSMLLRQETEEQDRAKKKLLIAVERLVDGYVGPYYLGECFSLADLSLAPYMDRMIVLEHYRDFRVPEKGPTARWHEWSKNVLERESVATTRQDRERIIEAYRRYAKCYVRNNWYQRVFFQGY